MTVLIIEENGDLVLAHMGNRWNCRLEPSAQGRQIDPEAQPFDEDAKGGGIDRGEHGMTETVIETMFRARENSAERQVEHGGELFDIDDHRRVRSAVEHQQQIFDIGCRCPSGLSNPCSQRSRKRAIMRFRSLQRIPYRPDRLSFDFHTLSQCSDDYCFAGYQNHRFQESKQEKIINRNCPPFVEISSLNKMIPGAVDVPLVDDSTVAGSVWVMEVEMVTVIWAPPDMPDERHIVVRVHRDGVPGTSDKGYFHISDEKDWGGSGPFDMLLTEVIERAKEQAVDRGLSHVVVVRRD
ncbi:hypothetical protein [Agrobacterium sp. P15N1-A]